MDKDMVYRKAAIEAINTWDKFGVDERSRIIRWHEGLEPYVRLRDVLTAIVNLPSAQPEHYGDCTGCKHQPRFSREESCVSCSNNYENKWRQKNG